MIRYVLAAVIFVCFASTHGRAAIVDDTPRIAVMSAFPPELAKLIDRADETGAYVINGVTFKVGQLEGHQVVMFLSGVSMVNAAMTAQLALDHFEITDIVFSGIAGGVDPELAIGDVVVAERWAQYLEVVMARETEQGWQVPPFFDYAGENFGMMHPRAVSVVTPRAEEPEEKFWFDTDPDLLAVARSIADTVELAECAIRAEDACLGHTPRFVVGGNGVSGGAFVDNAEFREHTFLTFRAQVLDMESAAVAHVAYANQTPFIAFRSLSDLAGGGGAENEIGTFFQLASDNAASVVTAFLAALPTDR